MSTAKAPKPAQKAASPQGQLTRKERRAIAALVGKARHKTSPAHAETAQQTIPYLQIYPDGMCRVTERYYTKTIQFFDINYQLAQKEDKAAIFEEWCGFLNFFDSSIRFQFTFLNQNINLEDMQRSIDIPLRRDADDDIREEYRQFLISQLAKGNNGMTKYNYLTFGIEADSPRSAKARLERIELDVLNNLKVMGVQAEGLNGTARLRVLHSALHLGTTEPFMFSGWKSLPSTGFSTKDYIAPSSFEFHRDGRTFRLGQKYGAVSCVSLLAPEIKDRILTDILELEDSMIVSLHVQSIDQLAAIKMIKRKVSDLDKMKLDEQKKAIRAGYDMDILPPDLATYGQEAQNLLKDLQSRNERMFLLTFTIVNVADTPRALDNTVLQLSSVVQQNNCSLFRLDFQQEQGLTSALPLGLNRIEIQRQLPTSSLAIFIPFTTQELLQVNCEALYCGLNALSNNIIMADRKWLKTPNGLILGTPGSGKSFAAKREITNVYFVTKDDIYICDPEGEYFALVKRLHGQVIRISATSTDYINPLDINLNYADDDNPIDLKAPFILSLMELIVNRRNGLEAIEQTVIDRCVGIIYQKYLADPKPENVPILGDLHAALLAQTDIPEAQRLAAALEIYVSGSLRLFNHRTNVDINNRLVCFDIKELGPQLKKLGMHIVQDQVWNRVTVNRAAKKATRYYIDEFHLLLKEAQTAAYSVEIWKRWRKWNGIPTGITQNVKDLLASPEIENILENSEYIYMLNQGPGDREILAKKLNISPHQLSFVTNSSEGEGLLFYGNIILPCRDKFPKDTELYRIMTTKPDEVNAS